MPKKKEIDIGDAWRDWNRETWYNVFITMFLQMNNADIRQYTDNVVNAITDAESITTIKHYYENNDRTVEAKEND